MSLVVEGTREVFISYLSAEVQKVRCLPSEGAKCCQDSSSGMNVITFTNEIVDKMFSLGVYHVEYTFAHPYV